MHSDQKECKKCGSIYRMSYIKICMRDKDSIDCEICGERLISWSEAKIWTATLIKENDEYNLKNSIGNV